MDAVAKANGAFAFGYPTFRRNRRSGWLMPKETTMPLIGLVVVLIVVGVLLWLVNTYIPMDGKIKNILNAVVVIGVVLWLLSVFGILDRISTVHIGKLQ